MKKIFLLVLLVFFGVSAIPAEAQWGPAAALTAAITGQDCRYTTQCGGYGGGYRQPYPNRGWGFNDPYLVDPRLFDLQELPPLDLEVCQQNPECFGRKGTFHSEEVKVVIDDQKTKAVEQHFRTSDSTHNPLIEKHGTCIPLPSAGYTVRQNGFSVFYTADEVRVLARAHEVESLTESVADDGPSAQPMTIVGGGVVFNQPVAQAGLQARVMPMPDPLAGLTWPTVNTTDSQALVIDPTLPETDPKRNRLISARGSINLPKPSGDQSYIVVLLSPGLGNIDQEPGIIRPSCDLRGWDIVARDDVGTPACQEE